MLGLVLALARGRRALFDALIRLQHRVLGRASASASASANAGTRGDCVGVRHDWVLGRVRVPRVRQAAPLLGRAAARARVRGRVDARPAARVVARRVALGVLALAAKRKHLGRSSLGSVLPRLETLHQAYIHTHQDVGSRPATRPVSLKHRERTLIHRCASSWLSALRRYDCSPMAIWNSSRSWSAVLKSMSCVFHRSMHASSFSLSRFCRAHTVSTEPHSLGTVAARRPHLVVRQVVGRGFKVPPLPPPLARLLAQVACHTDVAQQCQRPHTQHTNQLAGGRHLSAPGTPWRRAQTASRSTAWVGRLSVGGGLRRKRNK